VRRSTFGLVGAGALALAVFTAMPALAGGVRAPAGGRHEAQFYVALGDSLSVGIQPDAAGVNQPTGQGYPNQLYSALRHRNRDLRLVKLGCSGETTATMINGGICGYSGDHEYSQTGDTGSQLAAVLAFLGSHRGEVPLITIDIGANDLNPCLVLSSLSAISACVQQVTPVAAQNLAAVLGKLRAASPGSAIIGMAYYDPELASWLTGASGQAFAKASVSLSSAYNSALTAAYQQSGARIADVFTAFDTTDFTNQVTLIGAIPENVARICEWTWECAPAPRGPNEHANAAGYAVIAQAFLAEVPPLR
jgi:lysophospholipase L1-like esterase